MTLTRGERVIVADSFFLNLKFKCVRFFECCSGSTHQSTIPAVAVTLKYPLYPYWKIGHDVYYAGGLFVAGYFAK